MKAEDLIAEVAKRRGVVLTVADPAIILATVLELHLEQATKEIGAMVGAAADQMAAGTGAQVEAAKGVSQQIITSAGNWVSEQVRLQMAQSVGELDAMMANHMTDIHRSSQRALYAAVLACTAALALTCGLVCFLAA